MATVVAFHDHSTLVRIAYVSGTIAAVISALYSYIHMLRTPGLTEEKLAEQGLDDEHLIWVSSDLFNKTQEAAKKGELHRQTIERLIRLGLSNRD